MKKLHQWLFHDGFHGSAPEKGARLRKFPPQLRCLMLTMVSCTSRPRKLRLRGLARPRPSVIWRQCCMVSLALFIGCRNTMQPSGRFSPEVSSLAVLRISAAPCGESTRSDIGKKSRIYDRLSWHCSVPRHRIHKSQTLEN